MSKLLPSFTLAAAGLLGSACSSQAGTSYDGQPLVTLDGTVQNAPGATSATGVGATDAALIWANVAFSPNQQLIQSVQWVGESAPVSGSFPAKFTLNVYDPPPASVLIACPSSSAHIAVAFIVALPAGTSVGGTSLSGAIGEAYESILLYQDTDEPAGWSCLPDMGFSYAPTKGFHLLTEVPGSIEARAAGACYPAYGEAAQGLNTPLTLVLTPPYFDVTASCAPSLCLQFCESKATGCGAPSSDADTDCNALCSLSPTPAQISCIDTSDCTALQQAFASTGSVCGIGTTQPGTALDAGLEELEDASAR